MDAAVKTKIKSKLQSKIYLYLISLFLEGVLVITMAIRTFSSVRNP